jgi:hypothetical protein
MDAAVESLMGIILNAPRQEFGLGPIDMGQWG